MNLISNINDKKILITGGTGFIGGRLVEILETRYNVEVKVLVSNYSNVPRIARFPVEIVKGDLCNPADVHRAASGCDIVFHCAYGNKGTASDKRRVNIDGTQNVLSACLAHHVKRLVHLSTIMVYGHTKDGHLDEQAPKVKIGGTYSDTKLDAENMVLDYYKEKGLSTTVLQPTAVYGPYAPVWGVNVLAQLKSGRTILVNNGDGFCNGVYIDDLVDSMLLAAVKDSAEGENFIISGEEPITWKAFYKYFEDMLGYCSTVAMSEVEAISIHDKVQTRKSLFKVLKDNSEFKQLLLQTPLFGKILGTAHQLLPEKIVASIKQKVKGDPAQITRNGQNLHNGHTNRPIHPMSEAQIRFFATKTHFKIDKAKQLLGYQPKYDFDDGMQLTKQWSEAANLLNVESQLVS
ncbi:MAG: NAD-dependent epimerase/dehydratase family protein [Balneolales bacterium]